MTSGSFDETDFESLYFPGVNLDESRSILLEEEEGVFLIRDSSRGGYVICVKENDDVSQYTVCAREIAGQTNFFIREECPFKNWSSLLSFYKRNKFQTTHLKRPVSSERVILRRSGANDRRQITSEIPHSLPTFSTTHMRRSAPPDMNKPYESSFSEQLGSHTMFAKVVKPREPSVYYKNWLTLKVNDVIKVTRIKGGIGTGELNGEVGEFPLINVEMISKNDVNFVVK